MDVVVVFQLRWRGLDEDVRRVAREDVDALVAGVRGEMEMWNSGVVEESRRGMGEDEEDGEVRYLPMLARSCVEELMKAYKLSQPRQCRKQCGRRFTLLIHSLEHQHELLLALQQALQVDHKRTQVLASWVVVLSISFGLQTLMYRGNSPLEQMSSSHTLPTSNNCMPQLPGL